MPRNRDPNEARTTLEGHGEALAWSINTGPARAIVRAYREAWQRGESELTAFIAAADAALVSSCPAITVRHVLLRVVMSGSIQANMVGTMVGRNDCPTQQMR